ncbi:helix-turn-helix transcriptional regulator [Clostridium sp.]|uniref:helix-turn-helix transcriptional regulator n=1 Tax=Clostridium sp. TaxID=1506 RepID=UPI003D6D1034
MKNNIRELRKQLGFRQEDIATMLGVTRQTINAIENEKYNPTLELAMNLAKLLNTTVEKLFILKALPSKETSPTDKHQ